MRYVLGSVEIEKGKVTDQMIQERMKPVAAPEPPRHDSHVSSLPAPAPQKEPQEPHPVPESRDERLEIHFLRDVQAHPDSGIAARYKRLGISVRQGQKIKAYLAADGLIDEQEIRIPTGRVLRIRLNEKGWQFLIDYLNFLN